MEKYNQEKEIGSGGYGTAYLATRLTDGQQVCIKKVKLKGYLPFPQIEVNALQNLIHPFIVRYYEDFVENDQFHIVMEYVQGGDLSEYLQERKNNNQPCGESFILKVFAQLVSALKCCYENNVIHRDIKPSNILLTPDYDIKLTDFGCSKIFPPLAANKNAASEVGAIGY
jgi:serine/threonine protein kinase